MSSEAVTAGASAGGRRKPKAPALAPWPAPKLAYYTVFLMILSLTSLQLDTNIVPYVAAAIKADLKISDTDLGLLLGVSFALFYTLVGIPIAWLVDRYSRKWIIAIGIAVWSLGTALCGVAQNYAQLFFARFVVGAGEAGNGPASYSVLADLFPREKMPRAVAFLQLGSVIGPALALAMSAYLLHIFLDMAPVSVPWGVLHGWQLILILVGLPGVLVALLFIFTMPDPPRRVIEGQVAGAATAAAPANVGAAVIAGLTDYWDALAYMGRRWPVFAPMFGGLFISALGAGTLQWMPIFYQRVFDWHPAKVAGLQSIVSLIGMPLGLIAGVLIAERFAKKGREDSAIRTQVIGVAIGLPGLFGVLMPDPWLAFALGSLTFIGIGVSSPSQNAALQIVCPAQMRGKVTSLFLFFYSVVGLGLSPIIVGALNDFLFHSEAMIRWSIFVPRILTGPLALFVIWLGLKPYGREVARLKALEAAGG